MVLWQPSSSSRSAGLPGAVQVEPSAVAAEAQRARPGLGPRLSEERSSEASWLHPSASGRSSGSSAEVAPSPGPASPAARSCRVLPAPGRDSDSERAPSPAIVAEDRRWLASGNPDRKLKKAPLALARTTHVSESKETKFDNTQEDVKRPTPPERPSVDLPKPRSLPKLRGTG